jgi:hypothetical protein
MFDPEMPFTVASALDAGLTHQDLYAEFTRLIEGVYVSTRARVTPRLKAQAALLVHPPGAVVSHDSVLRMLGAPVALDPNEHVTVARDRDRRHRRGIRPHAMALRLRDVATLAGLPATVPERTFVDMAGRLPLVELVVLGDWMVKQGHTAPEALVTFCRDAPTRYAVRAAEAAQWVRPGVDSPQESRSRMLLVLAGLPEPEVGVTLRDDDGTLLLQIDMLYLLEHTGAPPPQDRRANVGIAVEYDGRDHAESTAQWEKDAERGDAYTALRLQQLRVTKSGVHRNAEHTVRRVHGALRGLGWPGLRSPSDDWRPHFGH